MSPRLARVLLTVLGTAVVASALPAAAHHGKGSHPKHQKPPVPAAPCTGNPGEVRRLDITVGGQRTFGYYTLPASRPRGLVVVAHGYGHTAESWRAHMTTMSRTLGVVALTMEYRGLIRTAPSKPGGLPGSRGWPVQAGAEDLVAGAKSLESSCKLTATPILLYGVSMGGNSSGLAVAMKPRRSNGRPLFDHWLAIEPAANVTETYHEAKGVAVSGHAYAVGAVEDIEREMGGTFADRHQVYAQRTVVNRVPDIAASDVQSVVIVHGVGDGLVPYNQGRELGNLLLAHGVPVDFTTVLTRSEGTASGTTVDGYVPSGQTSPFAGHGSEIDAKHDVVRISFERLKTLLAGTMTCGERVFDGTATTEARAGVPC